ncbi:MAG TPA: endonuclease/exonuclease/phosphatase family protein [Anaeromyxobacter sp.]|nr:endonuclease/exonuclease/phosphatase family protein [Anaeromyxobacter sp.]
MRSAKLPALIVSSVAALAACSPGAPSVAGEALQASPPAQSLAGGNKRVTVMTRNLYLGADLPALAKEAGDPQKFVAAVSAAWLMVQKNDFRLRAVALADEIAATRPALVGLQEAYTWRKGPAGSLEVVFDYVPMLVEELAARGLAYRPVASVQLLDIEAPTAFGFDVRATDHGVILASDLVAETRTVAETVYRAKIPFPTPLGEVAVPRGFVAVDAKIRGEWIRFVSTHLEAVDVPPPLPPGVPPGIFRILQAQELAAFLGADPRPTILVGDLNSDPGAEGQAVLAAAGFQDLWPAIHAGVPGLTDGFPEDLSLDQPLTRRIDYVLWRGSLAPLSAEIVGATAADKAIVGLWPSDHAGVVGTLRMLDERFAGR